MDLASQIREKLGDSWIPEVYAKKVRTQRTRSHSLDIPERENRVEILHTLLGIELKIGNKRFACPDLATARYLRVFGRVGNREFAVPYDITRISSLADEMETSWQQLLLMLEQKTSDFTPQFRGRIRGNLVRKIRKEIAEIGPGEAMPTFKQSTRQKRS
jgi:hypothetical protein